MIETVIIKHDRPDEEPYVQTSDWIFAITGDNGEDLKANASLIGMVGPKIFLYAGKGIRDLADVYSADKGISRQTLLGAFMEGLLNEENPVRL